MKSVTRFLSLRKVRRSTAKSVYWAVTAAVLFLLVPSLGFGDESFNDLSVPGNIIYNWTTGVPTATSAFFTIQDSYGIDDRISVGSNGSVDYFAGGGFRTNGAGVGLSSSNLGQAGTRTDVFGRVLNNGLALWNADLGAVRLFIPDESHGLGSDMPPTSVSTEWRVGDLFSEVEGFTGLTAGTQFHVLPVDSNTGNSGAYIVDLEFQKVPEPAGLVLIAVAGAIMATRRHRKALS